MSPGFASQVVAVVLGAGQLIARTEVVAVALVACAAAWLLAGWAQMRAAVPGASNRWCLTAGSLVVVGAAWPRARDGRRAHRPGVLPAELVAAARGITMTLLMPVALGALVYVAVDEGLPSRIPGPLLWSVTVAAICGLAYSLRSVALVPGRKLWQATRGGHVTSAVVFGEVVLAASVVAAAWAFTSGTSVIGLLEVGLVSVVARLLTLTRLPRAGLLVADVVFVGVLFALGFSTPAAVATVAVWRAGLGVAWLVGTVGRFGLADSEAEVGLPAAPTGSPVGEWVHRALFALIGVLPAALAARVRARVFGAMFSLVDDPWRYAEMPYEQRKQRALVDALPGEAVAGGPIVELGCADGHNLAVFAARHPGARVIGLDISPVAVAAATARCADIAPGGDPTDEASGQSVAEPQVTVAVADARGATSVLRGMGVEAIGVLVISEMLYYIGSPAQIRAELRGLAPLMRAGAAVVLVHGDRDAARLHPAAIEALGCAPSERFAHDDPERPFVVDLARPAW